MLAVAALGWSQRGIGIDGANSMQRNGSRSGESLRAGVQFIVKVVGLGDREDVADVR